MITELKGCVEGKECGQVYACICLDELKKNTRTVSKHNLLQDRDLNPEQPEKLRCIPNTRP